MDIYNQGGLFIVLGRRHLIRGKIIMVEYLPWSQSELEKFLVSYVRSSLNILDVELVEIYKI